MEPFASTGDDASGQAACDLAETGSDDGRHESDQSSIVWAPSGAKATYESTFGGATQDEEYVIQSDAPVADSCTFSLDNFTVPGAPSPTRTTPVVPHDVVSDEPETSSPGVSWPLLSSLKRKSGQATGSGKHSQFDRSGQDGGDAIPPPKHVALAPSSRHTPVAAAASTKWLGEDSQHTHRPAATRPSVRRSSFLRSRLHTSRFGGHARHSLRPDWNYVEEHGEKIRSTNKRIYSPGQCVLINNESLGWIRLVNQYGYPMGAGETPDEKKGPYQFVIAKVKEVHFDEVQPYYTVTVIHSGTEQRADAEFMHPFVTKEGEVAAMLAATSYVDRLDRDDEHCNSGLVGQEQDMAFGDNALLFLIWIVFPFVWLYDFCSYVMAKYMVPFAGSMLSILRHQATMVLDGNSPFMCPIRVTTVNFVVLCSIWYVFMDMVRLAFMPPTMDTSVATTNLVVWVVLLLELVFQAFIRPDGFQNLILTDKACSPAIIRYINWFHLYVEFASLLLYIPDFICICSNKIGCGEAIPFSLHRAMIQTFSSPTRLEAFFGHAYVALVRLRVFGLVRHWRNMWITNTFIKMDWTSQNTEGLGALIPLGSNRNVDEKKALLKGKKESPEEIERTRKDAALTNASTIGAALMATNSYRALVLFWCIFGLFPIIFCINSTLVNPVGYEMTTQLEATNILADNNSSETCEFLRSSIRAWVSSVAPPIGYHSGGYEDPFLMTVELVPKRCSFQGNVEVIHQLCKTVNNIDAGPQINANFIDWISQRVNLARHMCSMWGLVSENQLQEDDIADATGKRQGSILMYTSPSNPYYRPLTRILPDGSTVVENERFSVTASFDATRSVQLAATSCLISQVCLLFGILGGLSLLRRDAEVLVLNPLRRMLKIVAGYARNPLVRPKTASRRISSRRHSRNRSFSRSNESVSSSSSDNDSDDDQKLGSFETEQLITAVNKITDLLRKCWGVAGADIISTNLATREGALTEVFNPTVPGKSVYALFGFAYINDFDHILMSLEDDVMILINDVASVLHGEVFRWGFGDSGQCNKNLGAAFLMVFRIGLVKEVMEKLEQATDVIFSATKGTISQGAVANRPSRGQPRLSQHGSRGHESTSSAHSSIRDDSSAVSPRLRMTKRIRALQKKKEINPQTLSLQSLPGISAFTDRAVIGMLKAFAGIHRDNKIRNWNNDFRLSAGVGAFEVSMIFGMDAGWAVEGAVGSEYKIDATYLSPHVNMASRMMMASKQYGVQIMLSQSVQELMSDVANTKLRHLDTVTVKGSSVKQRIYTYDARAQGVDFFLISRTDEQADFDAERYTPRIWDTDPDLLSMRQHISDNFLNVYKKGHRAYIQGDWEKAISLLERANEIMVEHVVEEGYLEDQFEQLQNQSGTHAKEAEEELKRLNGDGPCVYLVAFMKSLGGRAPDDWEGWHPLTRK